MYQKFEIANYVSLFRFSRLQAHCLTPRTDVDQEDASVIDPWMVSVLGGLQVVAENIDERMDYLDVAALSSASSGEPSRNSPVEILLKVFRHWRFFHLFHEISFFKTF